MFLFSWAEQNVSKGNYFNCKNCGKMEGVRAAGGESHGSPSLQSADRTAPPRRVRPAHLFFALQKLNCDLGCLPKNIHLCNISNVILNNILRREEDSFLKVNNIKRQKIRSYFSPQKYYSTRCWDWIACHDVFWLAFAFKWTPIVQVFTRVHPDWAGSGQPLGRIFEASHLESLGGLRGNFDILKSQSKILDRFVTVLGSIITIFCRSKPKQHVCSLI